MKAASINRYRIFTIAVCLFLFCSLGICEDDPQEFQEEEITWEDIEGIEKPAQPAIAAPSSLKQAQEKKQEPQQAPLISKEEKEAAQLPAQAVEAVAEPVDIEEAKTVAVPQAAKEPLKTKAAKKPSKKKAPAAQEPPAKEENGWKHATTITGEDPALNRDIFVINPERE